MNRQVISQIDRARIVALIEEGHSQRFVANRVGVWQSDVSRVWNRYLQTNSLRDRPRSGRRRVTNQRQNRYIHLTIRRNPTMAIPALQRDMRHALGVQVSISTLRRRILATGLRCRRPIRVPRLQPEHRVRRLQWAQEHVALPEEFWNSVFFSDETRICLVQDSHRIRVWRDPTRVAQLAHARPVPPFRGGSAMFWAGIMSNDRTELIHVEGTMTGDRYLREILHPHVRLWRAAVGNYFVFMDDNARPHRTRAVNDYLETEGINRLNWPALSPDMNPIEHAWDMLARAVAARRNPPRTVQELVHAAQEEWRNIPQQNISNLVNSMGRRLQACINSRGGNTLY